MHTLIGNTQILEMRTSPITNGADVGYEVRSDWVYGISVWTQRPGYHGATTYVQQVGGLLQILSGRIQEVTRERYKGGHRAEGAVLLWLDSCMLKRVYGGQEAGRWIHLYSGESI